MEQILQSLRSRGYAADGANFPTGRPDRATLALVMRTGEPAAAKVYPSGGCEITYANMQELWRSSFGERHGAFSPRNDSFAGNGCCGVQFDAVC